jgi:DNA-binding NarL/FixJ family response regulator
MRVAIVSGERLFLDSLVAILSSDYLSSVTGNPDPLECVRLARTEDIDLLIVDLRSVTPNDVGFILGAQSFGNFRTIGITDGHHPLPEGFTAGVARTDSAEVLLAKAKDVTADVNAWRSNPMRRRGLHTIGGVSVSKRELDVARLVAKGFTNRAIADAMEIKEQSVKNLVSTVLRKLRCENRVQVALRMGEQSGAV